MMGGADAAAVARRMREPIDWQRVSEVLHAERKRSVGFLSQALAEP